MEALIESADTPELVEPADPFEHEDEGSPRDVQAAPTESDEAKGLLELYYDAIGKIPLLTAESERSISQSLADTLNRLIAAANSTPPESLSIRGAFAAMGDDIDRLQEVFPEDFKWVSHCRNQLIEHNARLAVHIAQKYKGRGITVETLVQEANIGLIKAVDRFDLLRGLRFSTYAYWWVTEAVQRAIKTGFRMVRVPDDVSDQIRRLYAIKARLEDETGYDPSSDALAKEMGLSKQRVEDLIGFSAPEISGSSLVMKDASVELIDTLVGDEPFDNEEAAFEHDRSRILDKLFGLLTDRERHIVAHRFGINMTSSKTLEDLSAELGVSRERVRQVESEALRKLRYHATAHFPDT